MSDPTSFKCDVCGAQAVKWFGLTSAVVCENPKCEEMQEILYAEALREIESEYYFAPN